ncbi:VanW family protein [Actinomyces dentalis]|uniref:VanW family protein n=1 Tax=Actinomyces dentalis TaxID=272548 RepID=UPI0028EF0910|nr:VanW family protein [Actinomyces dentalis]
MSGTVPLLDSDDAPESLEAVAESSAPSQDGPVVAPPEAESAPPAGRRPERTVVEGSDAEESEPPVEEPAEPAEPEEPADEEPAEPEESVEEADAVAEAAEPVESEESAESVVAEKAGSVPVEVTSEPESEAPVEESAESVVEPEADEPAQPAAVETGTVAESAETETEAARSVEPEADENTGAAEEIAVGVEEPAQEEQSAEAAEPVESEESADPEPVESESAGPEPEPESAEKADAVAETVEPEGPVEVVDSVQGESAEEAGAADKTAVGAEESAQGERSAEPAEPVESETAESEAAEEAAAGSGTAVEEVRSAEPAIEGQSAQETVDESTPAPPSAGAPPTERAPEATAVGASAARPPLRPNFSLSAPTPATADESAAGAPSKTIEHHAGVETADMPLPPSVPIAARTPERDDASEEAAGTIGTTGRAPAGSEAEEAADDESEEARDEQAAAEPAPPEQKKSEAVAPARRRRLLLALGAAALLVLVWGAAAFATTQHIFAGSTVSGVAVGNMSPAQAESTVAGAINAQLGQPVTLVVGNATDTLVPAESGVSVDARASVERLTGFTLNPLTLIGRLRGADVDAVTRVDARSLTTALDARLDVLAVGASDAGVTLNGTTPVLVPGSIGTGLDVDSAVTTLSENWPLGRETIELPDGEARPAITDEEAQTLIDKVLTPLLSSDFTITVEGTDAAARAWRPTVVLTPEQLAELVRIGTADGDITASLDPQGLRETVLAAMGPEIESPVQDATWTIEGRADAKPVYVEAHGGTVVDADALAADVLTAATQDGGAGERRIALPMIDQAPAVTTPAADWGMNQVIGEYSTPYYPDAARTQNLVAGTAAINGTVVMPGGVFSLTDALGPIDEEHGFASAGVVTNGQHTDAMGGGLSQVATTVFNAGFEAGMDDVEHTPHNYWFTRYPAGREATLWTGNLDVKFGNSTPTAVMVQAWAVDGEVHVRLWGTPYYQVSIDNGTPHNYRAYQTQRQSGGNCVPYGGGAQGFDITVTRSRTKPDGQKLPDDVLSTSYDSDNPVVCG